MTTVMLRPKTAALKNKLYFTTCQTLKVETFMINTKTHIPGHLLTTLSIQTMQVILADIFI